MKTCTTVICPTARENNRRLALYTAAMAEVAKANDVPFVDLYRPTLKLYAAAAQPLTINGVHLTEDGDKQLAEVIDAALFADSPRRSAIRRQWKSCGRRSSTKT